LQPIRSIALTPSLLTARESELARQGAPCVAAFNDGVAPWELARVVSGMGIDLAPEVETWWGWHDGMPVEGGTWMERAVNPETWQPLPVVHAVEIATEMRQLAEELAGPGEADSMWPRGLLPVAASAVGGACIAADCGAVHAPCVPLHYVDWHDETIDPSVPFLPALGTLVTIWLEALVSGEHWWDSEAATWGARRDPRDVRTLFDRLV
jgi:hypothetical protein